MKIQHNYVQKHDVQFCTEDFTLQNALDLLDETNFRCIPVLDKNSIKFMGNIYKVDILEYIVKNKGSLEAPISTLIQDKDGFIYENTSFFKAFFTIRKLPYIAVIDERDEFLGILTHSKVMDVLEDSFGVKRKGYTITIATSEYQGVLTKLLSHVKKFTNVEGILSLDTGSTLVRRVIISLSPEMTFDEVEKLIKSLDSLGYRVIHVDQF